MTLYKFAQHVHIVAAVYSMKQPSISQNERTSNRPFVQYEPVVCVPACFYSISPSKKPHVEACSLSALSSFLIASIPCSEKLRSIDGIGF